MGGYLGELRGRLGELAAGSRRAKRYRVPRRWNSWGFPDAHTVSRHEIEVEPVGFLIDCLDRAILPLAGQPAESATRGSDDRTGRSLSSMLGVRAEDGGKVVDGGRRRAAGDWIARASAYSLIIRHTTAWDHDGDGDLQSARITETGTFLKTMLLLPQLVQMGINLLYLLPVSKCSQKFRKGELGCPYSAKNFFELEPDLHDRMLGRDAGDVELEFGAMVEAAHALGMRVMIDLAPRTAARDSDLILQHPDWFYWIDRKQAAGFGPPQIPGFERGIPNAKQLAEMLRSEVMQRHLSRFRYDPRREFPERWESFVEQCRPESPKDLLRAIGKEFGVITPPGFSDVVNDPQPPWSDVTFLRLYLDHPAASVEYLPGGAEHPPYVFTDTIKASLFPGRQPNRALWETLASILPFYQRMGVDGARVDMGHALPAELQRLLIQRARQVDPDFCFLAEQFDHAAAKAAKREGFNAIIGCSWAMLPRVAEGQACDYVRKVLPKTALVSLAAPETPDTPRAMVRDGGAAFARAAAVLMHFLPRAIPFLNSGLELLERQPMNLGLDNAPPGRYALPKSDPNYGRLAYFDRAFLHWGSPQAAGMIDLIRQVAAIRREYLADLVNARKVIFPEFSPETKRVLAVGWRVRRGRDRLVVVANLDWKRSRRGKLTGLREDEAGRNGPCQLLLQLNADRPPRCRGDTVSLALPAGSVQVFLI